MQTHIAITFTALLLAPLTTLHATEVTLKINVDQPDGKIPEPLCAPSRAGFFSGLYQQRFGFNDNDSKTGIPTDLPLLPGVLKNAGYRTCLLGKWHSEG